MRRVFRIASFCALVLWLLGCGRPPIAASPPAAQPSVPAFTAAYRLYSPTAADHVYSQGAQRFADLVKQRTGGRISISVVPDGGLAKGEREALEGLRTGTIDLFAGSTGTAGNFAESFLALDLPFLFRDYAHADRALDGPIGQSFLSDLGAAQIKGLAFWENGFRNLTNNVRPVKTPADVKGLKLRTMENQVHVEAWRSLGANPTPLAWSEVFDALKQGRLDAQENPVAVIYSSKLFEVQKQLTLTRHVYSPALVAMSAAKFAELPKADQDVVVAAAAEVAPYQRKLGRDQEAQQIAALKQRGMDVVESVDTAAWQSALKPVFDKYAQRFGDRLQKIGDAK